MSDYKPMPPATPFVRSAYVKVATRLDFNPTDETAKKEFDEWLRLERSKAWVQGAQSFADAFWDGQPGEIENPYEQRGWKPE